MDDIYMFVFKFDFFKINPTKKKGTQFFVLKFWQISLELSIVKDYNHCTKLNCAKRGLFFL